MTEPTDPAVLPGEPSPGAERADSAPVPRRDPGSEARRALVGVALGAGLGLVAALFSRRDRTDG